MTVAEGCDKRIRGSEDAEAKRPRARCQAGLWRQGADTEGGEIPQLTTPCNLILNNIISETFALDHTFVGCLVWLIGL
jgi:hypothetical protein